MRKVLSLLVIFAALTTAAEAQQVLTLDSCRQLALRNNKQLSAARMKQEVAQNTRKATRTGYLPKVDALGGYEFFSKEISILNKSQKSMFANLGTTAATGLSGNVANMITSMAGQGLITPEMAQQIGGLANQFIQPLADLGNEVGQKINDAFKTNTKHIWAASVMVRQPIYTGGALTAMNRMADISEDLAANETEGMVQNTLYSTDEVYWTVVSLKQKQRLAYSYRDLVQQLDDDVHKMIREGIATRASGLQVDVKVNEADMQVTQVEDGLVLAKMLLCQLCGLPLDTELTLADEDLDVLPESDTIETSDSAAFENRRELRMLQNAIALSEESTKLLQAANRPQVALTGGYLVSNPNVFNGFERKFSGVWNVGILIRVPVWNWYETRYKVNASRAATNIATMQLNEAREKVELQLSQCRFKLKEASKRLAMAQRNLASADENLRCANVGFREGVMEATDVLGAQTAWQLARSQKIDAEVELRLAQVGLQKALGILQ